MSMDHLPHFIINIIKSLTSMHLSRHCPTEGKKLSKPWITKGIRASNKMKNKLYMSGDDAKYKDYRNKISLLTRLSKKQYFSKFLNGNLTNMKRTWEGINDLLNPKKKQSVTINVLNSQIVIVLPT